MIEIIYLVVAGLIIYWLGYRRAKKDANNR